MRVAPRCVSFPPAIFSTPERTLTEEWDFTDVPTDRVIPSCNGVMLVMMPGILGNLEKRAEYAQYVPSMITYDARLDAPVNRQKNLDPGPNPSR